MPAGRPSKYRPEFCEQAKKLVSLGATDKDMANFFEVSEQTLNSWKKQFPEFLEALTESKEMFDARVERSLYERALGYSHKSEKIFLNKQGEIVRAETIEHYPPDPTSMIFWLKNRQKEKWRDRVETDITSSDGTLGRFVDGPPQETRAEWEQRILKEQSH